MELNQLKLFLDLVREGSFTRVAEQNRLTQPAVSLQIQRLENELGAKLLERTTRRVLVTEEGNILAGYARDIVGRAVEARQVLQERRGKMVGAIRVAAIHSVGLHELPNYLRKFIRMYPEVHLHIEYHASERVYHHVTSGAADVGLVAYPEQRDNLVTIPFLEDEMVVIVNPEHPLAAAGRDSVRLEELAGADIIAFDNNIPTRRATDGVLVQHGVKVNVKMECDNVEIMKKMVEVGMGIALVPQFSVLHESDRASLVVLRLQDYCFLRPLGIIHRKGQPLSRAVQAFVTLLTDKEEQPPAELLKPSKRAAA
ncbi:MAG TPA: LysR family transcriptional regulator [Armatimonadota bacterium]|jgi:DNA-binding transcriptional LysR family regulator